MSLNHSCLLPDIFPGGKEGIESAHMRRNYFWIKICGSPYPGLKILFPWKYFYKKEGENDYVITLFLSITKYLFLRGEDKSEENNFLGRSDVFTHSGPLRR